MEPMVRHFDLALCVKEEEEEEGGKEEEEGGSRD